MPEISVEDLAEWRKDGRAFVLLDVRDADEIAVAAIPDAVHIPMSEIPARIGELDPTAQIAVLCHHGGRSERVADFLAAHGFARAVNVEGGINAYAERIDRQVPIYR